MMNSEKGDESHEKQITGSLTPPISVSFNRLTALQIDGETIPQVTFYTVHSPAAPSGRPEKEASISAT